MLVQGKIVDVNSGDPVSGATVELWTGNIMLNRGAANENGIFSVSTSSSPDKLKITSASYKPADFGINDATSTMLFELEPNIIELDPFQVTATIKKKGWWLWAAALVGVYFILKEK